MSESVSNHTVISLEEGSDFSTKQMSADGEKVLPRHKASVESVLIVVEGSCLLELSGKKQLMSVGDTRIIPADEWHQITAHPSFRAVHVMPKGIRFEFAR